MKMNQLLSLLLVLAMCHSAAPLHAAIALGQYENTEFASIQADNHLPANTPLDRRMGRSQSIASTKGALRGSWTDGIRSWLLLLALAVSCFVWSTGSGRILAEDLLRPSESPPTALSDARLWNETPEPITLVSASEAAGGTRYQPSPPKSHFGLLGGGEITLIPIAEYPRIPSLDVNDSDSVFYTWRANLFNMEVPEEWDFQNLINTDRPDFTDATFSVGKGVALLETGYTFRKSNSTEMHLGRQQLPEALLRVGVTDEFELRIKWVGQVVTDLRDHATGLHKTDTGSDDLQLGFKYEIAQQEGWRPMFTFVGGAIIPSGTRGVSSNQVQPFANLVYGWGIRRWLYLKGSTGVDFAKTSDITQVIEGSLQEGPIALNVEDNISQWHQSFSLLFQATQRVGGFVEWFSFFSDNGSDNRASHFIDTGLYIYMTPNVQLDVRIGERLSNRVDTIFTGAGFSTRW